MIEKLVRTINSLCIPKNIYKCFGSCIFMVFSLMFSCKEKGSAFHAHDSSGHPQYTNALVNESSPYLLQHAHNPVDWMPWGDAALETAQQDHKLIVLSIGYASCHWCHVMEKEAFSDTEVAELMNANFINIKVDREERPDVDQIYQTASKLVNGHGGWPLNVIMLPNGKPIYLGTYLEKEEWISILSKFKLEYEQQPEKVQDYASMLAKGVQQYYEIPYTESNMDNSKDILRAGIEKWSSHWDKEWGGDMGAEKFVGPIKLEMLLNHAVLNNDETALRHVMHTLQKVAIGGIYDHIGGGFFRYSTDSYWRKPHFEKMLYDNAQLLQLYSKAYQVKQHPLFKNVVYETFTFLQREMSDGQGGYYSSLDADSEGKEGGYYLWDKQELESVLGDEYLKFSEKFNIKGLYAVEEGDFLPFIEEGPDMLEDDMMEGSVLRKQQQWKNKLLAIRQKRKAPEVDDKIITSWNALLVDGLVQAYKTFDDQRFLTEAERTFRYLISNSYKNGQLVHAFKKDSKQKEAFLEDYAFLAKSSLSLYEVTLDTVFFNWSKELMHSAMAKYRDESGMYTYTESTDGLISKIINIPDDVLPSANAIMAELHLKIGHMEYNKALLEKADLMLHVVGKDVEENLSFHASWGSLWATSAYPFLEVVVVGENAKDIIAEIDNFQLPNTMLIGTEEKNELAVFKGRYVEGETLIYICQNKTCKLPVRSVEDFLNQMDSFGYTWLK